MAALDISSIPFDARLDREWLATNGLGGFASSTIVGPNTRKYHGLLVAAMSPPVRQMVLLSRVEEFVLCQGRALPLASCEYPGVIYPHGYQYLRAFNTDPFPRWAYQGDGWTLEKQLRLQPGENTVCLSYTLLGGDRGIEFELNPLFALRGIHELMYQWNGRLTVENIGKGFGSMHRIPPTSRTPEVFFAHDGRFQNAAYWYLNTIYRCEEKRGYPGLEDVWLPGSIRWTLAPGQTVHFVCSTDPIDLDRVISRMEREDGMAGFLDRKDPALSALLHAADQFVVQGSIPVREKAGEPSTCILAGYPWVPPAGRDALISFAGLLLVPGRLAEAKSFLQTYASLEDGGLMPSEFPSDGSPPKYQGADVSLWFVNAVWQYLRYGGEPAFVARQWLPTIDAILRNYRQGTRLGIHVDAEGLLVSHEPGTPSTWMDAKAGEWVVTPRYGRAVEVNALWYNAQRIGAALARSAGQEARSEQLLADADCTHRAFNSRFWNDGLRCCFDVVGDESVDDAIRPNQIFAVSLPFPVLVTQRHQAVLDIVRRELLTPFGLRTLAPNDLHYACAYGGAVIARDRAYHQGTVFPWLLGPYVTALLKVCGRGQIVRNEAREILRGCLDYMSSDGLGQLCELFDGESPHHPGGLRASARSIAEVLRAFVEEVLDVAPAAGEPPRLVLLNSNGAAVGREALTSPKVIGEVADPTP